MSSVNLVLKTSDLQTTNLEKVIASNTPVYRNIDPPTIETVLTSTYSLRCVAYDSNGIIYVGGNGFIQKYVNNSLIFFAGNGTEGNSPDGGQASNSLIGQVRGISFDSKGNLFFTDFSNSLIRRIDINGVLTTISQTRTPYGLIIDKNDNIYFSSYYDYAIYKIYTTGNITLIAGTYDQRGFSSSQFYGPRQIEFNKNQTFIYVVDFNETIRKVDFNSGFIFTVAGTGNRGISGNGNQATSATLNGAIGVTFDFDDNIFIAEQKTLRKVDLNGIITFISGNYSLSGNSGDGGNIVDATFNYLAGLRTDLQGNILVVDNYNKNIRRIILKEQIEIITLQLPLFWQVNMESLLGNMYNQFDRFKICPQYMAGSTESTKNLVVKLSGLPFQYVYNLGGKNNSTITIGTIKDKSFYSSYSLSPYYNFTRQAMANILIEFYDLENNVKDNTNIDCIFSFNIIGDENFKKIYRLL
jgi:hypothetical protein